MNGAFSPCSQHSFSRKASSPFRGEKPSALLAFGLQGDLPLGQLSMPMASEEVLCSVQAHLQTCTEISVANAHTKWTPTGVETAGNRIQTSYGWFEERGFIEDPPLLRNNFFQSICRVPGNRCIFIKSVKKIHTKYSKNTVQLLGFMYLNARPKKKNMYLSAGWF